MDVLIYLILFFMGVDRSKPPSPEVPKLIKLLGDDEWKVREAAQHKLEKMGPEIHVALEEAIEKNKDLEIRKRCQRILPKVLNVYSDDKDNWCPSIYSLPNAVRFPKGYDMATENNWEGKFTAKVDLGRIYFEKARKQYNKNARTPMDDKTWRDQWVEKDAMQLFMRDLRIKGVPANTCKRILNWSVDSEKHYSHSYSSDGPPPPAKMNTDYSYGSSGCYQYNEGWPDGNWKNPHTIIKWKLQIREWPTPKKIWEKYFPPEPTPMYEGHPCPTK